MGIDVWVVVVVRLLSVELILWDESFKPRSEFAPKTKGGGQLRWEIP